MRVGFIFQVFGLLCGPNVKRRLRDIQRAQKAAIEAETGKHLP